MTDAVLSRPPQTIALVTMPKDFAGRSSKRTKPRKQPRRKSKGVLFHGPSFSSGALVGAAVVILAAYAPELLREASLKSEAQTTAEETPQQAKLTFDFPDILRESEVSTNPDTYKVSPESTTTPPNGYLIQAASFRSKYDAEQLRAQLLLKDLPAQSTVRRDTSTPWHRVIVGPFSKKIDADRAMTTLREQNLSAIWVNSHN
jgi:cell division protein FtsN